MNCVDVVIPCYNYGHFLEDCVNSVLSQEGVNVRVLIIDDCSSDDSRKIGQELAARDERVEFRHHAVNCGHIATYNEGLLGWASADYSLLLSADDALAMGALARAVRVMRLNDDVGMTYGMAQYINGNKHLPEPPKLSNDYKIISGEQFLSYCFSKGNALETPTAVVRTKLQQRFGGYDPELPHSGDMEMWMRFASNGPVGVVHAVQAYYRIHDRNMSRNYYNNLLRDSREVIKACEKIYLNWGDRFSNSSAWRAMMYQRLIEECYWVAGKAFEEGDIEGFRDCYEFVGSFSHNAPVSKYLWRLRIKKLIGLPTWKTIKPCLKCIRRIHRNMPESQPVLEPREVRLNGWWPKKNYGLRNI